MTGGSCVGLVPWRGHFHDRLARSSFVLHPSFRLPPSPFRPTKKGPPPGSSRDGPFLIPDPRQALLGTLIRTFILRPGNPISREIFGQCRKAVLQREIGSSEAVAVNSEPPTALEDRRTGPFLVPPLQESPPSPSFAFPFFPLASRFTPVQVGRSRYPGPRQPLFFPRPPEKPDPPPPAGGGTPG